MVSCVILFIAYLPAILLNTSYGKTRNLQSKESHDRNPTYGIEGVHGSYLCVFGGIMW